MLVPTTSITITISALLACVACLLASLGAFWPFSFFSSSPSASSSTSYSTATFAHGHPHPGSTQRPVVPRWKVKLCSAHAALVGSASTAFPGARAEEIDTMVDIFSALHLSPSDLAVPENVVLEAWRVAVSEAMELPVCLRGESGEGRKECRRYKSALALAARAVQDRDVKAWWDAEMARILKVSVGGNKKKGWAKKTKKEERNGGNTGSRSGGGQKEKHEEEKEEGEEEENKERTRAGRRKMKTALDSFCIGL